MSVLSEVGLTCRRELRKNLRSAKGIAMGALFLLGGGAASLIYIAVSSFFNQQLNGEPIPAEKLHDLREELWTRVWGKDIGHYLADAPLIFVGLFKVVWWFVPFLTLLIGFEQICGDLQYRTMRYDVVRARRSSIVIGKALAIWAIVSLLVLALMMFVWTVTVIRGDATFLVALSWGGRFWGFTTAYIATWAGMTVLVSSLTRRPVLSLFIGLIAFAGIGVGELSTYAFDQIASARYAFPGFYQEWFVTPRAPEVVGGIAILLAFGAAATAGASYLLNRSDV